MMFPMAVPAGIQMAVEGMSRALPDDVLLVGGGASTERPRVPRCRRTSSATTRRRRTASSIMLISGPLRVSVAVGTGWRTIGPAAR